MNTRAPSRRRAFTVVELIAAVSVIAVLGVMASSLIVRTSTINNDTSQQSQLHTELATAMERVDRTLRQIRNRTGATDPSIQRLAPTSIAFNGGSSLTLTGGDLRLDDGSGVVTILSGVTGVNIQAFDASNAPMAVTLSGSACDPIRRLAVTVTAARAGLSDTLRTKVYLRSTLAGAAPGT